MDRSREKLIEEALQLPEEARAALGGILLESLDGPVGTGAESTWAEEIDRRVAKLDTGASKLIPWSLARRQILGTRMTTPPAGVDFTPEAVEEARSAFAGSGILLLNRAAARADSLVGRRQRNDACDSCDCSETPAVFTKLRAPKASGRWGIDRKTS